jgi:hypothetical protein
MKKTIGKHASARQKRKKPRRGAPEFTLDELNQIPRVCSLAIQKVGCDIDVVRRSKVRNKFEQRAVVEFLERERDAIFALLQRVYDVRAYAAKRAGVGSWRPSPDGSTYVYQAAGAWPAARAKAKKRASQRRKGGGN